MSKRTWVPTCISLAAMMAGFYSLVLASAGSFILSAQWIMVSMVLDGLDGNIARLLRCTSKFGAELDTYVDMTSFGLAPALLAYLVVLKDFGLLGIFITSAMVLSGVIRLSRFRIKDPHRGQRGYQGLPITVNACWVALFIFITESGFLDRGLFSLERGSLALVVWTSSLLFTMLQVSNVRYPKPTKEMAGFIPCALFVMLLFLKIQVAVAAAVTICVSCFVYAFVTPLLPKRPILVEDPEEEESYGARRL